MKILARNKHPSLLRLNMSDEVEEIVRHRRSQQNKLERLCLV